MELSEGHNHVWRKLRSVINPRKRSVYSTLTTTDEHNNVTKHTTTEQKLDAFADQLTKTFTNDGDTTNYDNNWKQTVDAYIDTNSQMLNVLDHLGGNVLHDENRITLPELDAKLKHLNTKKAKGHDRISNKIISCILPSLTPILHPLYNILVYRGHYPMVWKRAMGLMILKPNQTLAVSGPYLSSAISGVHSHNSFVLMG